jgi:uncharacterized protein (DUF1800 family)
MHTETILPAEPIAVPSIVPQPAPPPRTTDTFSLAPATLALLGAALLAACGGGGGGGTPAPAPGPTAAPTPTPAAPGFNNFPSAKTNDEAARFLLQSELGATDANIAAVRATDFSSYLQQQFNTPTGNTAYDWVEQRGYGVSDTNRYFFATYPAEFVIWKELFSAPDSMRKRTALALSEFFVASMQSAEFNWRGHAYANWWDMLSRNAFGNFRQMLEDVTLHPAMGYFLNTKGNQKENLATGRVPDENYAREVMQLFTIGLFQLNLDGTPKVGGDGKELDSYTQDDVTNLARVFTGYDFDTSDTVRVPVYKDGGGTETYTVESRDFTRKPMALNATRHSTLEAKFLGATVAAGTAGQAALKTGLDTLFNHPNVGPFFGKQMIQRLVTSNPSKAYVARVAAAFNNNGAGVRGDMKAVWTAILLDDEARGPQGLANPGFGKLREPMLRLVQWGRSFNATSAAGSWKMFDLSNPATELGQSPLRAPSVFNFFRPGFVPPGTALAASKTPAPEFQLVNETSVGGYLNYMQKVIRAGIFCPEPTVVEAAYRNYVADVAANYAPELALVGDAAALVARLNLILCAGQLSAATQSTIVAALNASPITATSTANQQLDRVSAAVLLVMASPEYLIQK